jgi:serine/threonine protein kinase/tetratricopeptide (TPR) repeat protein
MPDKRTLEPIEPTLLPESKSVPSSPAPTDTPAHPGAHDVTIKPKPAAIQIPRSNLSGSVTEADATRAPLVGGATFVEASEADATQVPPSSRTGIQDKTVGNSLPSAPLSSPAATGTQVGRFALKVLHARGGLGEVFTARDTELNREVAVKRIQTRYADDPASRRRFLTEAEITARLDHPGVVPVFGLVADGFGRPCYAMRFIRGETLKDEIERYHGGNRAKTNHESAPNESQIKAENAGDRGQPRSVAFRHLLQRFIAVCQAIAYAHSRKVIHRDIKPANVMVGAFGETLVVDWGLAKALDDGPDPEQLLRAVSATGFRHDPEATEFPDHLTLAGTAVGTPAYMAPEQASGRIDLVGPSADVYSLGATLFAILTGKAPFAGNTTETLEKVRRGEFPKPLEENPEVPAPLDAVCQKAMALRVEDRYATPLELALDVERWLSDEPVSCYRDPFVARLARWARRHPARVAAGVSLLLAGILAAGGIAWAVSREQKKTAEALVLVTDEKLKTDTEMKRAQKAEETANNTLVALSDQKNKTEQQYQDAQAARGLAEKRYKAAVDAFNTLVFDIQLQLADRAGTQDLRQNLLIKAQEGLNGLLQGSGAEKMGADRTLVAAHSQMGEVYQLLGKTREARGEYEQAVRLAVEVLIRAQERRSSEDEWDAKQALGHSSIRLADSLLQTGNVAAAKRACETAVDLMEQTLKLRPDRRRASENLALARDQYADVLIERGETQAAAEQCRIALELRRQLAATANTDPNVTRQLADSLDQYAEILLRAGRTSLARQAAADGLGLRIAIATKLPQQPEVARELAAAHSRLGEVLLDRDELAASQKEFEEARTLLDKLHLADPRSAGAEIGLAVSLARLAAVALRTGDVDAAIENATASNRLCRSATAADPDSIRAIRALATSHELLGEVYLATGANDQARAAFQESVKILEPIAQRDPDSVAAKLALAHAREQVGQSELASGQPAAAIDSLNKSLALRQEVLDVDRGSAKAKRELAQGLGVLADAQRAAGQRDAARATVAEQVRLLRQVCDSDTDNGSAQRELALATGKWGELLAESGKSTVALIALGKSLDQLQSLANQDQANAHARGDLASGYERLADVYLRLGQIDPALAAAHTNLELRTELAKRVGETKASRRELASSMIRFADSQAAGSQFGAARKWYTSARTLVSLEAHDARTAKTAHSADEKLALLDAVETLTKDPINGLASLSPALRIPALKMATDWLLKGKKTMLAATLAWELVKTSPAAADRYRGAVVLTRCATATNVTAAARESFAEDAIKALELAVAVGFRDVELLKGPDWESSRARPEFQKIVKSLDSIPSPAANPGTEPSQKK